MRNRLCFLLSTLLIGYQLQAVPAHTTQSRSFEDACLSFPRKLRLEDRTFTVNLAQYVPAGTNLSAPDHDPSCHLNSFMVNADTCRIALHVKTSNESQITMEAWLPRNYTGRILALGNAAISGCISYTGIEWGSVLGFATVGSNNGHNGTSGLPFLNHPEVIEDFVYRAMHTTIQVGKELTPQFYGTKIKKSYYLGCSTGGRQGFKSAQDFPEDFDGLLPGSAAIGWIGLMTSGAQVLLKTGLNTSDTFVPWDLWSVVHQEVMRQCDTMDGAQDSIIEDPDMCQFIPESLICAPGQTTGCLTAKQARTVREIYEPFYGSKGELLFPRLQPGAEGQPDIQTMLSGVPFQYSTDWFRYVVYNDSTWDPLTFTIADAEAAYAQNPFNVETLNGDLSAFANRGGKLIFYHGLEDSLITSENSKRYYAKVSQTMGLPPSKLDDFFRFFTISSMGHCSGGIGAVNLGTIEGTSPGRSPDENVLMALVRWVEEGIAPEVVRGAKLDDQKNVLWWRAHCRWPRRNVYVGPGNVTDENAWKCV